MNIKGAIFDMDGTLIDSLILWDVIWGEFGKRYLNDASFRPSDKDDKTVRTTTLKEAMNIIHSNYAIGKDGEELLELANNIMRNFYANDVKLKSGVLEFLEYCYEKGIKMCVASATEMSLIETAINHCNIGKYFTDVLSCAETGKGKDKPDIYLKALSSLGTKTEETCIFEDSLVALNTAKSIGMKTVGIYDKFNYGHEEMKKIADVYVGDGETLGKVIDSNRI